MDCPLLAVPFSGEDICRYFVHRQDIPNLTKVRKTPGSVQGRITEIRRNWEKGGYNCTDYEHLYYPKYRTLKKLVMIESPVEVKIQTMKD